ncbi:MAG: aspartate aminotransferase family protein [Spirochaetes bacterium]|nr:aspartate aminotransferase family protein [Spirochaetota bacterium]
MNRTENTVTNPPLPNNYASEFLIIKDGKGVWLRDISGKKYLDFTGGIAVNALGYGRADLAEIAYKQMKSVTHTSNLFTTEPVLQLAVKMVRSWNFSAVHFSNSGSEANETAIKYARLYSSRVKGKDSHKLLCFSNGFHGRTLGALSCTPKAKYQEPFMPLLPGVTIAEYNNTEQLLELADSTYAGIIVEVVQGEGGLDSMTEDFARALNETCKKYDILLIADEIQTGLSRTGTFYASEGVGLQPDIITLAKPLAGGLPLSATLIPDKVNDLIHVGEHGTTFGGGPVTTAVASKIWDILSDKDFIEEVKQKGDYLNKLLSDLKSRHGFLGSVKGKGLLAGIRYRGRAKGKDDKAVQDDIQRIMSTAREEEGLLILRSGTDVLRFAPPLIISREELALGVEKLESVFKKIF